MSDPNPPDPTAPPGTTDTTNPERNKFSLPGAARTGAWIHLGFGRKKITSIKILRLTFKTDHHVMTDNNTDWTDSGTLFTKPEWAYGSASKPISHTKNQNVDVSVDFEVNPANAEETDADITGTAAFGSLVFTATKQKFKGGTITVDARTTTAIPDLVQKLAGDISWSVNTALDGTFDVGASWGHTVYVTMDTPISVTDREAGFTLKRMDKSVELVQSTGMAVAPWANAPGAIVKALMGKISGYTLVADPAVPVSLNHPQYFNGVGGAWNMADFIANSAECQAIVRFFRAVIKQVGCPGLAQIMLIYADPNINNGNTVLEDDFEAGGTALHHVSNKMIHGVQAFVALLDEQPIAVGKIFDGNDKGRFPRMGANAFEACLKFTDPAGVIKYYPGGVGGAVIDTMDAVINVFQALAWLSLPPGAQPGENLVKVEEIVKKYH
jgi:hypothetical protein